MFKLSFKSQVKKISTDYTNNIKLLIDSDLKPNSIARKISGENKEWANKNRSSIRKIAKGEMIVKYPSYVMFNRVEKLVTGNIIKKNIEQEFKEVALKTRLIIKEILNNRYSIIECIREIAQEEDDDWCKNRSQIIRNIAEGKTKRVAYIYADRLEQFVKHQRRKNQLWKKNMLLVIAGSAPRNRGNQVRDSGKD